MLNYCGIPYLTLIHACLLQVLVMFLNLRDLIFVVIEDILRAAGSALETSEFVVRLCFFISDFLYDAY